eukprot:gi/632952033/ref/XP_007891623.1/ PREDICTED: mitochondrial ribonuclease P protein 3 [Callorhinchus milii]
MWLRLSGLWRGRRLVEALSGEDGRGRGRARARAELPRGPLTAEEWAELRARWPQRKSRFEVGVMERLLSTGGDLDVAKSLLAFAAARSHGDSNGGGGGGLSYELLLKYLALCVKGGHGAEVGDVYQILRSRFKALDTGAHSLLISGFSPTERWREAAALLDALKRLVTPSARNYGDVMAAALRHGEAETAWALYREMVEGNGGDGNGGNNARPRLRPSQETLQSFFDCCRPPLQQHTEHTAKIHAILSYLRDGHEYPGERAVHSIRLWFESIPDEKWEGRYTTISNSGKCRSCNTLLESISLSEEEYSELRKRVLNDVIQGNDVFKKTTPLELEHFQAFVKRRPPFDVVIDGLNVANISAKVSQSKTLLDVVSHLAQQGLRLLVLGRKHMLRGTRSWDRNHMAAVQKYADCFFTEDISEDDPFLLYATIQSGNHCRFLSRDLMRDHKACLVDTSTQRLFFKWQRGHQLVLSTYNPWGKIKFEIMPQYDTIVQTTGDTWHIPYDEEGVERCSYEVPHKWLCLKKH